MNLHRTWKILGAGALALSAAAVIAAPPTLGKNLIKNPGAEAGPGAVDRVGIVAPPQWTITGNVTAAAYGSPGMPNDSTPGPPKRGENFFAGGPLNALSKLEQRINVKALADQINTGNIGYSLAGYLGGRLNEDDNVAVTIDFADADGVALGSGNGLEAVLASARGDITSLLRRKARGAVPINTQFILVTLTFTRSASSYNDGYADQLSLILNDAP
jgi:hypothetical protein